MHGRQHLLRVEDDAEAFADLFAAVRQAGGRVGWLELTPPSPLPPGLEAAAAGGVLRAVAVGGGRSVAVKPIRGEPVLRDLLREHFRGCALVLVRHEPGGGAPALPRLEPDGPAWRLRAGDDTGRRMTSVEVVAALRKPHPWKSAGRKEGGDEDL